MRARLFQTTVTNIVAPQYSRAEFNKKLGKTEEFVHKVRNRNCIARQASVGMSAS
jgi:hypothetical protein